MTPEQLHILQSAAAGKGYRPSYLPGAITAALEHIDAQAAEIAELRAWQSRQVDDIANHWQRHHEQKQRIELLEDVATSAAALVLHINQYDCLDDADGLLNDLHGALVEAGYIERIGEVP